MKPFFSLLFFLVPFVSASAQEPDFLDYEAWIASMSDRVQEYTRTHACKPFDSVRLSLLDDLDERNLVAVAAGELPPRRKKAVDSREINRLCRLGALLCGGMKRQPQTGAVTVYPLASATALSADGLCVTNYHVLFDIILSGALRRLQPDDLMRFVMDEQGHICPIREIVAADPVNDFVLFRVDVGDTPLTPIPLGETATEGEEVYCLSHPRGLPFFFSRGMVSRNVSVGNRRNGHIRLEMQITADYGVGASGGPIIDGKGNLVGIVGSNYSFYADQQGEHNFQLTVKKAVPVKLLHACLITGAKPRVAEAVMPAPQVVPFSPDTALYGVHYLWSYRFDREKQLTYKENRVAWVAPSVSVEMSYQGFGDRKWRTRHQGDEGHPTRDPSLQYTMTPDFYYYQPGNRHRQCIYRIATEDFLLTDTVTALSWQVTDEERMVGEYICRKATCTAEGREWTAWFTTDLPHRAAPRHLDGLPGVVLEAYDQAGDMRWEFREIVSFDNPNERPVLRLPTRFSTLPSSRFPLIRKLFALSGINYVQESGVIPPGAEAEAGYPSAGADALRDTNGLLHKGEERETE